MNNVTDELIKLKKLLDENVLTQDEFDAQKKKLLEDEVDIEIAPDVPSDTIPIVKQRKNTGCILTLAIFTIFIGFVSFFTPQYLDTTESYQITSNVEKIMNMTKEQSRAVETTLKSCGIADFSNITEEEALYDKKTKIKGYTIISQSKKCTVYINKNNEVHKIRHAGNTLYSKGKKHASLKDFTFEMDEISQLQFTVEEKVKSILKSPSTAKFPNYTKWGFSKNKSEIEISAYVDSQNGFGAQIRSDFYLKINRKDNTIISFIFDNEELIK